VALAFALGVALAGAFAVVLDMNYDMPCLFLNYIQVILPGTLV
jgi:hypothetical protein